jgi:hypothetical protein
MIETMDKHTILRAVFFWGGTPFDIEYVLVGTDR